MGRKEILKGGKQKDTGRERGKARRDGWWNELRQKTKKASRKAESQDFHLGKIY